MKTASVLGAILTAGIVLAAHGQQAAVLNVDETALRNWMQSGKGQGEFRDWAGTLPPEYIEALERLIVPTPTENIKREVYGQMLREVRRLKLNQDDPFLAELQRRHDALSRPEG